MMTTLFIFWGSITFVFYTYFGYALLLYLVSKLRAGSRQKIQKVQGFTPGISIIIPVYNEAKTIQHKIANLKDIRYPVDKLDIIFVSDGSNDRTCEYIERETNGSIRLFKLKKRAGKAAALNLGLSKVIHDIVVFTDASIMLEKSALMNLIQSFIDPEIGCISGEDFIAGQSGEGVYGRYELLLRNLESKAGSIVGASGSFYGQRKDLCENFIEGMAPDFLSVLNTVEKGYRAVTEPTATGEMSAVKEVKDEFSRKVRTLIRGMTALFARAHLLNPLKYGFFAIQLISHKILRWLVPFFLTMIFIANLVIIDAALFYQIFFILQILFYLLAFLSYLKLRAVYNHIWGKLPLYFVSVNCSIVYAWIKYLGGFRQELWNPSQR